MEYKFLMNVRTKFEDSNLTALEYWARRMTIDLSDYQMRGLIDGFEVRQEVKGTSQLYTFCIKGVRSEDRYKNASLLATDCKSKWNKSLGIIEGRKKLVDFYTRITQGIGDVMPEISFSAVGHMYHVNKIGGVHSADLLGEENFQNFNEELFKIMHYMKPIFEQRADKIMGVIKAHDAKARVSPWGVPYR